MDTDTNKRNVIRWSGLEWQNFSDACYSIVRPILDSRIETSLEIDDVVNQAQEKSIPFDRRKPAVSLRVAKPFLKAFNRFNLSLDETRRLSHRSCRTLLLNPKDQNVVSDVGRLCESSDKKRTVRKWTREELSLVSTEYLVQFAENPALNRYDVLQLAMNKVLPKEKHRNKYSAWNSLITSGVLSKTSKQQHVEKNSEPATATCDDQIPTESIIPQTPSQSVITFDVVESSLAALLQPILLKLSELHNRIDSVGRQAGMAIGIGNKNAAELSEIRSINQISTATLDSISYKIGRISSRLKLIGPDEEWESDIHDMLENVLGKVANIEEHLDIADDDETDADDELVTTQRSTRR